METEKVSKLFSLKEVAEHNSKNSAWLVIHDQVFDVTEFLQEHPGGKKILLEHAGKDSTEDFEDNEHSPDAIEMMQDYLIGELIEEDRQGSSGKSPISDKSGDDSEDSSDTDEPIEKKAKNDSECIEDTKERTSEMEEKQSSPKKR